MYVVVFFRTVHHHRKSACRCRQRHERADYEYITGSLTTHSREEKAQTAVFDLGFSAKVNLVQVRGGAVRKSPKGNPQNPRKNASGPRILPRSMPSLINSCFARNQINPASVFVWSTMSKVLQQYKYIVGRENTRKINQGCKKCGTLLYNNSSSVKIAMKPTNPQHHPQLRNSST